jgi:poly(hydroxyalkanoate) granule-associated protein
MVKKLKAMAKDKDDNQLARAVRDSAHQIWLAGLGAFSKAREERNKVFEALVKEGRGIQQRIGEVTGKVNEVKDMVGRQATDSWDRLEQVFEDRVSRALARLGVPTSKDIKALMKRVDELTASVQAVGGKVPSRARAAASGAKPARKPAARKAAAAKAPAKKAARKAAKAPAAKAPAAKAPAARKAAAARRTSARKAATPETSAPAVPAAESSAG